MIVRPQQQFKFEQTEYLIDIFFTYSINKENFI